MFINKQVMLKCLHCLAPNESAKFHLLFKETMSTKLVVLFEVSCGSLTL